MTDIHSADQGSAWCERLCDHDPADGCFRSLGVIDRPGFTLMIDICEGKITLACDMRSEDLAEELTAEEALKVAAWLAEAARMTSVPALAGAA